MCVEAEVEAPHKRKVRSLVHNSVMEKTIMTDEFLIPAEALKGVDPFAREIFVEIFGALNVLREDMAGLKTDMAGLKTDVADLKTDVAGIKSTLELILQKLD